MASVTLTWETGGGSGTQTVQYKRRYENTWIDYQTGLPASQNSLVINSITDLYIYDFRVINNCAGGVPTTSGTVSVVSMVCPSVSTSAGANSIGFTFTPQGADVSKYIIDLLDAAGTNVLNTVTVFKPFGATVSGTFNNLPSSTGHNVRVTMYVGQFYEYNKVCPLVPRSTGAATACNAPTNLSVEITGGVA